MRGVKGLFSQCTTALFDPRFFFFFCSAAYLVRLSLPQENVIILRASIRWLSFKTCIRKALHHNRSVGACLLVCVCGGQNIGGLSVDIVGCSCDGNSNI